MINLFDKKIDESGKLEIMVKVSEELKKKYQIDLKESSPINGVEKLQTPILLIYGTKDVLVLPHHSLDLYKAYGGKDKKLVTYEGGHNDYKPQHISKEINAFIARIAFSKDEKSC